MILIKKIQAIGVSDGIRIGYSKKIIRDDIKITKKFVNQSDNELLRFLEAKNEFNNELDILIRKTRNDDLIKIYEVHKQLINDLDYIEYITNIINNKINVEWAIKEATDYFSKMFLSIGDEVFKSRVADLIDIRNQFINILNKNKKDIKINKKVILVLEELLPSDFGTFELENILGIISVKGSRFAHSSIIARTLNIPLIVGIDSLEDIDNNILIAINGETGEIFIKPSNQLINDLTKLIEEKQKDEQLNKQYFGKKAITMNGKEIIVAANVGKLDELDLAIKNDADAIGLFRSEFIFLDENKFPTEEEQFLIYKQLVDKMKTKNVIVRTLDIGADKVLSYFKIEDEENPALGYRGIRISLNELDIFKTQLRALYRASAYGNLSIMFPMITHVEQVIRIKEIIDEVKSELENNNLDFNKNLKLGIMIETPAAVMISDKLAKLVDFFSIGTNDLTQYTLAVDRMNSKINNLFDQSHESILRMIEMVCKNSIDSNIWVGICGESASNLKLLDFYINVGIKELSVSPNKVLKLKKEIINKV